ncbi:unnamed protein product [Paramecium sonneborni]|uniref:Uncharacterized protein n=1 Tax=Paramecium sonneborni TaxID=65129 RepID=A0A8S1QXJ8_9CILI|nr:unnamed protein product [Paramecium sonneborni]
MQQINRSSNNLLNHLLLIFAKFIFILPITENQFSKWLNHIDNEKLTNMALLISKHLQFLSEKGKLYFENRIKKLSNGFTNIQICSLIQKEYFQNLQKIQKLY